ncbi:MAG: hypothetical protein IIB58_12710 [Planctomycetes bacterium]|nr:hypothetical protein [Planctomycetota bacterium]
MDGPVVDEVRKRAMEISARYDHDLEKYFTHLLEYQEQFQGRLVDQLAVVRSRRPEQRAD